MKQIKMDYRCPMHPEVHQEEPGNCPLCGMSLDAWEDPEDIEYKKLLRKFWIGLALTLFIVFVESSPYLWIQCLLCTPVVLWSGKDFFQKAYISILQKQWNMFTLIALGIGTAYVYSTGVLISSLADPKGTLVYFNTAAMITVFVLLGQILESKARKHTGWAMRKLTASEAKIAHLVNEGNESLISAQDVCLGDILRVKPGEQVPVDGIVLEGASFIDTSLITGEAIPRKKEEGDDVIGGTINQNGSFLMKATKVGKDTLLARIIRHVNEAQQSRAPIQRIADQISNYFVQGVLGVAMVTFICWWTFAPERPLSLALMNAVAVLVMACPCALGLATPMAILVGIGRAAELGILIRNGEALEILGKVNVIALDKTGTLTIGQPTVMRVDSYSSWSEDEITAIAASLEVKSEHPIAKAIVNESKKRQLHLKDVKDFHSISGQGVSGNIEGTNMVLRQEINPKEFYTTVALERNREKMGVLLLQDPIRPSAQSVLDQLHLQGMQIFMLTGDHEVVAQAIGKDLKLDGIYAGIHPLEKSQVVQLLKQNGSLVAMVGDGVNDAPALAAADVGIAMGSGVDVAIETADVVLVKSEPESILGAITISRSTMRVIKQNLFFAFIYNGVGIPAAAGIFYPMFGLDLTPPVAAAAMALSSVSVVINSLRLRFA